VSERPSLTAERRTIVGKAVKRLRWTGRIPASLVESHKPTIPVHLNERELAGVVRRGHTGHLVNLTFDGAVEQVLLDDVDVDAITNRLQHAVLRRVDLTKPVHVTVPVHFEGTPPAAQASDLVVIHALNALEVSALPTEIPSYLIADVSGLSLAGDAVRVAELRAADGAFTALADPAAEVAAVHHARAVRVEAPAAALPETEIPAEGAAPAEEPPEGVAPKT